MSFLNTQPYKGTRDFFPEDKRLQNWMFEQVHQCLRLFGYQEYDGPLLEPFEVYAAKTGEEIVNQQLYWMMDRGDRKMAIRPEMTPTLARMVAAKFQDLPKPIRWYSIPNLYRYEKPQKGRLREHWQLNVDILGGEASLADLEVIRLALDLFKYLKGERFFSIQINNRKLMDHFFIHGAKLAEAQISKASKAIDARAKISPEEFKAWLLKDGLNEIQVLEIDKFLNSTFEQILAHYPCEGASELEKLFASLKPELKDGRVKFDPSIMRGFDYYTGTVFEGYDVSPENRRALFGGGRYDNLVGMFGKNKLSGIGFGLGDVTLGDFLKTHELLPSFSHWVDVYVGVPSEGVLSMAQSVSSQLRVAGLSCIESLQFEGFGAQLKNASKLGSRFAVLLGEEELKSGEASIKDLKNGEQFRSKLSEIAAAIKNR